MYLNKTDAVVIHCTDFGESDIIATLYTHDLGKIQAIAKGAKRSKKRFINNLQPFSYIRIVFSEGRGGLIRLDQADIIHPFFAIGEDIFKVLYGSYFLELVKEMTGEKESNPQLFQALVAFLALLNDSTPREEYLRAFELRVLDLLGYRPRLLECTVCTEMIPREEGAWFSYRHGGVLCKGCQTEARGAIPISGGTLTIMEMALRMDLGEVGGIQFSADALSESREILPRFIQHQLGKGLKSLKVMEEVQGGQEVG